MNLLSISILFTVAGIIVGLIVGLSMFFNAALVLKMQIKFYEKINWHMEPISMPKEIKNTKFMGLVLIAFCLLTIIYIKLFLK